MPRIATIFVLFASVPLCWQPLRGQAPSIRKDVAKNPKQNAKLTTPQPQIGTEAAPLIVETHARAESKDEAAEAEANKKHAARVEVWTLLFTGIAALFTGGLVIVGWGGVRAAVRTLKAIEHQGSLMEAQFNQWVILDNWRVEEPHAGRMRIRVDLINPTQYPITLSEDYMDYIEIGDGERYTKYVIGQNVFMSPNSPTTIELDLPLTTNGQVSIGLVGSMSALPVSARLSHSHKITKKIVVQPLIGKLQCSKWQKDRKWHAMFTAFSHMNPKTDSPEQSKGQAN